MRDPSVQIWKGIAAGVVVLGGLAWAIGDMVSRHGPGWGAGAALGVLVGMTLYFPLRRMRGPKRIVLGAFGAATIFGMLLAYSSQGFFQLMLFAVIGGLLCVVMIMMLHAVLVGNVGRASRSSERS